MRTLLPLTLLLAACSAKPDDSRPLVNQDANTDAARRELEEARLDQEEDFQDRVEARAPTLRLGDVTLSPQEPRIDDVLEAEATLRAGHSPFAEIAYTWYVNDKDILGVSAPTLDKRKGRWKKFDRVKVVATATDETGAEIKKASEEIIIANSTPEILSDISRQHGLNGLRLRADDPDDDPLTWSILDGPPGVTISSQGVLRVEQRDLKEAYHGEVVIAATDPDGARSEIHIPVDINAAEEGRVEEKTVQERRGRNDGTLDDYAKAQEKAVQDIDTMTPEQFDKYIADQEKNADR
jgi:hypothetical protein